MIEISIILFLKGWAKRYVENRDAVLKNIISIEESEDGFFVKYKDKEGTFLIVPVIKDIDVIFDKLNKIEQYKTLVVLNSQENIDAVTKNWDKLVSFGSKLNIYFVNPFSKLEKIWIISPYVHDFIADRESLELGLKTMSENVEYAKEEEMKKIIEA